MSHMYTYCLFFFTKSVCVNVRQIIQNLNACCINNIIGVTVGELTGSQTRTLEFYNSTCVVQYKQYNIRRAGIILYQSFSSTCTKGR